jgi:hypothetical protein
MNPIRHIDCSSGGIRFMEADVMTATSSVGTLVVQMQAAFLETSGLTLTLRDAQRRFGVDAVTCEAVLGALLDAGVLKMTAEGGYTRLVPRQAAPVRRVRRATEHAA